MLMMMVVIACYSIIIISANDDDKGGEIMTIVMLKMVMTSLLSAKVPDMIADEGVPSEFLFTCFS